MPVVDLCPHTSTKAMYTQEELEFLLAVTMRDNVDFAKEIIIQAG